VFGISDLHVRQFRCSSFRTLGIADLGVRHSRPFPQWIHNKLSHGHLKSTVTQYSQKLYLITCNDRLCCAYKGRRRIRRSAYRLIVIANNGRSDMWLSSRRVTLKLKLMTTMMMMIAEYVNCIWCSPRPTWCEACCSCSRCSVVLLFYYSMVVRLSCSVFLLLLFLWAVLPDLNEWMNVQSSPESFLVSSMLCL